MIAAIMLHEFHVAWIQLLVAKSPNSETKIVTTAGNNCTTPDPPGYNVQTSLDKGCYISFGATAPTIKRGIHVHIGCSDVLYSSDTCWLAFYVQSDNETASHICTTTSQIFTWFVWERKTNSFLSHEDGGDDQSFDRSTITKSEVQTGNCYKLPEGGSLGVPEIANFLALLHMQGIIKPMWKVHKCNSHCTGEGYSAFLGYIA